MKSKMKSNIKEILIDKTKNGEEISKDILITIMDQINEEIDAGLYRISSATIRHIFRHEFPIPEYAKDRQQRIFYMDGYHDCRENCASILEDLKR